MIPRLALLGAIKHYKRSLVVLAAVSLSCAMMLFAGSLLGGVTESFYDSVATISGHVRIDDERAATALAPLGLDRLLADADAVAREAARAGGPGVLAAEPVLSFGALLLESGNEGPDPRNLAMRGIGVAAGTRFADNVRSGIVSGEFLPGGRGVALSESAARLAGTALGEGIVVLVQDASGQPWYEELPVTGIFRTESRDFDETTFYVGIGKAREMLDVGSQAREVRLLLARRDDARRVSRRIGAALASAGEPPRGALRVMDWTEINASVLSMLALVKALMGTLVGLFAVVSGTIIANTVLMSVLERIREFGAMRAIGLRARSLELLIMAEGAILGTAGSAAGIGLGAAATAFFTEGLDLGGIMESVGLARYAKPSLDPGFVAFCAAASVLVSLAATAQAARSVARRGVAESLAST